MTRISEKANVHHEIITVIITDLVVIVEADQDQGIVITITIEGQDPEVDHDRETAAIGADDLTDHHEDPIAIIGTGIEIETAGENALQKGIFLSNNLR